MDKATVVSFVNEKSAAPDAISVIRIAYAVQEAVKDDELLERHYDLIFKAAVQAVFGTMSL